MTTENELEVAQAVHSTEPVLDEKKDVPSENDEMPVSATLMIDESLTTKGDEPIETETSKVGVGKKQDTPLPSDTNHENLKTSNDPEAPPLFEQPILLEGKRSRKPTARLEISEPTTPKKEVSLPQGNGKPLGEIEYINYQITQASTDALSRLYNVCFGRRVGKTNVQKSLCDFKGFEFDRDSDEYRRHLNNLSKLKQDQLRSVASILGLTFSGRNTENAERILNFLVEPVDEGKAIPERKISMRSSKKLSTHSKESMHTDDDDKLENGDDDLFDDDEDMEDNDDNKDEDFHGDTTESDKDYLGSDDDTGRMAIDDPDDFVYRPGKRAPKRKAPVKRPQRSTGTKRKRVSAPVRKSTRSSKRSNVAVKATKASTDAIADNEPTQTDPESVEKTHEDQSTTKIDDTAPTAAPPADETDTKLEESNGTILHNAHTDSISASG